MKSKKPKIYKICGIISIISIVLSLSIYALGMEHFGYNIVIKIAKESIMEKAYRIERPAGVYIKNITGQVEDGKITSIDIFVGLEKGNPPINVSDMKIHYQDNKTDSYYIFSPSQKPLRMYERYFYVSVITDPDNAWELKQFNENAILKITLPGINISALGYGLLYFIFAEAPVMKEYFTTPPFISIPPLYEEYKGTILINDPNQTYPRATDKDWIITNETLIQNKTIVMNGNIVILTSGKLELYNVTLLMNSTQGKQYGIYVGTGGYLEAYNTKINSTNTAAHLEGYYYYGYRYNFCIYGKSHIDSCEITYFSPEGVKIYSDDVKIINSTISFFGEGTGIFSQHSSPTLIGNLIANNNRTGIQIENSSPRIYKNVITNNGEGIGIGQQSKPIIDNNTVADNHGDGISCFRASPYITNNTIAGNGQGIRIYNSLFPSPLIKNNYIFKNNRYGIEVIFSSPIITNNKIMFNQYGIFSQYTYKMEIMNNEIAGNTKYGVESYYGQCLYVNNNTFTTEEGIKNGKHGLIQKWSFTAQVIYADEIKEQDAKLILKSKQVPEGLEREIEKEKGVLFLSCTEYIITNEGVTVNYTPHTLFVEIKDLKITKSVVIDNFTVIGVGIEHNKLFHYSLLGWLIAGICLGFYVAVSKYQKKIKQNKKEILLVSICSGIIASLIYLMSNFPLKDGRDVQFELAIMRCVIISCGILIVGYISLIKIYGHKKFKQSFLRSLFDLFLIMCVLEVLIIFGSSPSIFNYAPRDYMPNLLFIVAFASPLFFSPLIGYFTGAIMKDIKKAIIGGIIIEGLMILIYVIFYNEMYIHVNLLDLFEGDIWGALFLINILSCLVGIIIGFVIYSQKMFVKVLTLGCDQKNAFEKLLTVLNSNYYEIIMKKENDFIQAVRGSKVKTNLLGCATVGGWRKITFELFKIEDMKTGIKITIEFPRGSLGIILKSTILDIEKMLNMYKEECNSDFRS